MMNNELKENDNAGFWDWGKGLAVVIALFVVTTLSVVFYLVSRDYYMVNENHYEEAVAYQQQINRIEHTRSLKNPVEINRAESQDIRIQFPDSFAALQPTGTVKLYRPSDSNLDQSFQLSLDPDGVHIISAADIKKLMVQVTWQSTGKEYFQEAAIFL